MKADIISTPASLTIAEVYTKAKRGTEGNTVTFTYPEGVVTYERTHNEYATFPVVYEMDVRDAISAVASMNPRIFKGIKVFGKLIGEMTIFVVIATNKSCDDAEIAQGIIARQLGFATVPFVVKGDISLDNDFLSEDEETVYADGLAACADPIVEEPAPISPELEEAYASLEKAIAEAEADPTSKAKKRRVDRCKDYLALLGGEV